MAKPLSIGFNVPNHAAIKAAADRGVQLPEIYYSGQQQGIARQTAFSIAGIARLDQLQAVRDSLAKRTIEGSTFAEWKKEILKTDLNLPNYRLETIYRTNLQGNYNRGRWQRFQAVKLDMPYLMYDAINDSRVRPSHLEMDGIIRPIDDSFWKTHYPPNGYNCRCHCIALNDRDAAARSQGNNGLNKPINAEDMQPDKGWDYNCGKDPMEGIDQAIQTRQESALPSLVKALQEQITEQTIVNKAMTTAQESIGKIESIATTDLVITDKVYRATLEDYLLKLKAMALTWFVIEEIKRIEEILAND